MKEERARENLVEAPSSRRSKTSSRSSIRLVQSKIEAPSVDRSSIRNSLDVQNIRGQGYDGASNMRGEWNGLQALFLNECPYAYYRNDELHEAQSTKIAHLISIDELETGRGATQISTLQRAGDTRWSAHFKSICSLIKMFGATCIVLKNVVKDRSIYSQRGDADAAYDMIPSFEFVFIMHLIRKIMGRTDILCQALQQKTQDISNAMHLVATTKALIQKLREDGWDSLVGEVKLFCERYEIEIPNMSARYSASRGPPRIQQNHIIIEYHYRIDIFIVAIDSQLQELNHRFSEHTPLLLAISVAMYMTDDIAEHFEQSSSCNFDKFLGGVPFLERLIGHIYLTKDMKEILVVLRLIVNSPCLQELQISGSSNTSTATEAPDLDFWEKECPSDCTFSLLETVKMTDMSGVPHEMEFIKFLLRNSPMLETMSITPSVYVTDGRLNMLIELVRFRRASAQADIIFIKD
ncbi:uncharacterized protein LOC114289211 [Camellia sinensis]|nr:uncharacterized protein LOC114289211 [Camellia sinensis]